MFISPKDFKKLVTKAYKGTGLKLARKGEHIYIGNNSFMIRTNINHVPNKIKAIIIEYTGELPGDGEMFTTTPMGNQIEVWDEATIERFDMWEDEPYLEVKPTNILLDCKDRRCRVYQNGNLRVMMVNILFDNIVSPKDIDKEYENYPEGPYMQGATIIWTNETTTLMYAGSVPDDNTSQADILEALSKINI